MNAAEVRALLGRNDRAVERAILAIDRQNAWTNAHMVFGQSLADWIMGHAGDEGQRLTPRQMIAARNMLLASPVYLTLLAKVSQRNRPGTDLPSPIPGERLRYEMLPGGVRRAIHVLAPVLQERLAGKAKGSPVIVVRSEEDRFTSTRLFRWVEIMGPSSLEEWFNRPLPGTQGRGVIPLITTAPLRVWLADDADVAA